MAFIFNRFRQPFLRAVGLAVGIFCILYFVPNYYRSEACLLPVEARSGSANLGGLSAAAATFGIMIPTADGPDSNFIDIVNSRYVRDQLLATRFEFKERSWRFGSERPRSMDLMTYLKAKNIDQAERKIRTLMGISRDLKSRVITLTAETRSADLSRQIVLRTLELLESFLQEKGRTRGSAKAVFSAARLDEAQNELNQAEDRLRMFLNENRNYSTSFDPAVRIRGARLETDVKLRQQLLVTIALNHEQALLEEKNDIPILNVLDRGNLPIEKSWPPRGLWTLGAFFLIFFALVCKDNWEWILKQLEDRR